MNMPRAPCCLISSTTRSPNSARRPVMTTSAPSSANRKAVALPIPDVAPVMIATLFDSFMASPFLILPLQEVDEDLNLWENKGLLERGEHDDLWCTNGRQS